MRLLLLIILVLYLSVQALSFNIDSNWVRYSRANKNEVIDFHVALYQKNLDILKSTLLDVSNPLSSNYGKYWDMNSVLELVAPEQQVIDKVEDYLYGNGVSSVEVHSDFMKVSAPVSTIEKLFNVEMYNYKHTIKKHQLIRSIQSYTIPNEIKEHIHLITGLFELPQSRDGPKKYKFNVNTPSSSSSVLSSIPKTDPGLIVPATLQNLYGIPTNFNNHPNSSLCLAEFQSDRSYNPKDLATFAAKTGTPLIKVSKTIGKFLPTNPDDESSLDVQYGGAIAGKGASVWFWTVNGWMYEFATALVESVEAPFVTSMSWGWPEQSQCDPSVGHCTNGETSQQYIERVNIEYQKIGLRGITLLAASGDQGSQGTTECGSLNPMFPASSEWVVSVGATMLNNVPGGNGDIYDDVPVCKTSNCAKSTTEIACQHPPAAITTGGGFSNSFARPYWQNDVVDSYLNSGVELPPSQYFNSSNRGFPDVSSLGHNYYIIVGDEKEPVDGTSASSPVFGGIVTLLNSYRFNNNKGPLGFINPVLYAAAASNNNAFTDITSGDNKCNSYCCSKIGYVASKGWDPVTGLGSPNFKGLLSYIQDLN